MSTTDGTVADQSTVAANASSEAVASSSDVTPRLSAFPVDDGECDDEVAVFADRQEREANSWPARTVAELSSSRTRRNSERSKYKSFTHRLGGSPNLLYKPMR